MWSRVLILLTVVAAMLAAAPAALATSNYASDVMTTPSLIGYWRLGEQGSPTDAEGMPAADATGNYAGVYHQAVDLGVPGAIEGVTDTAAEFGEPDGYMDVPYSASINPSTFSVEAWVRLDNAGYYQRIVSTGAQYTDASGFLLETLPDYSKLSIAFVIGSGTDGQTLKTPDVIPGIWYYVVATYDGTTARLYMNGQLASSVSAGYSPNTVYPLRVAQSLVDNGNGQLDGSVDELALYGSALPATTVQQHYQAGINDGSPPQTQIQASPSGTTNQTSGTITFTSSSVDPTYQCRLDGGSWTACSSPYEVGGLGNGSHTLRVRTISRAGLIDPSPPSASWTVDTTPPLTTFASGPSPDTASAEATLVWGSSSGATYTCVLDDEPAVACISPYFISGLTDGEHTLAVQATDSAGNTEADPVTYTWTVDTAAPSTFLLGGPTSGSPKTPLLFVANKTDVTFRCTVDSGSWEPCSSPMTGLPRTAGTHVVEIDATDAVGNVQPTPVTYKWTVPGGVSTKSGKLTLKVTFPHRVTQTTATRKQLTPRLSWHVTTSCTLLLTLLDHRGRRVAASRLRVRSLTGIASLPPGLLSKLRPGAYTVIVQGVAGSARSSVARLPFTVSR